MNLSTSKKVKKKDIIAGIFALIFCIGGVYFYSGARYFERQFQNATKAEPIHLAVDLSRTGRYTEMFQQTCDISHGEQIIISVTPPFNSDEEARRSIDGLLIHLCIKNNSGEAKIDENIESKDFSIREDSKHPSPFLYLPPFKSGNYQFSP